MSNVEELEVLDDTAVQQYRNQVNAYADQRLAAQQLREKTVDLALQAKALGRSLKDVQVIVDSVVAEVFAPDAEPAPLEPEATPAPPPD